MSRYVCQCFCVHVMCISPDHARLKRFPQSGGVGIGCFYVLPFVHVILLFVFTFGKREREREREREVGRDRIRYR